MLLSSNSCNNLKKENNYQFVSRNSAAAAGKCHIQKMFLIPCTVDGLTEL